MGEKVTVAECQGVQLQKSDHGQLHLIVAPAAYTHLDHSYINILHPNPLYYCI